MAFVVWQRDYTVGVESLDADHIVILSLINHIHEAKQSGSDESTIGAILKVLLEQARAHFEREETLLEKYAYPELEQHKEMHRVVGGQLDELYEAFQVSLSPEISEEIIELLAYWLDEHILEVDKRYKAFLEKAMA